MSFSIASATPLDAGFQPSVVFNRAYVASVEASGRGVPLILGLEREAGQISRYETVVDPTVDARTLRYIERIVKFLLWARGGWRIWVSGPAAIGQHLKQAYSLTGERAFDVRLMGRIYQKSFEVVVVDVALMPKEKESSAALGGYLDGCRIGFDLGASDYKVAAVEEGEVVFSAEYPWNPKEASDPTYHFDHIQSGLKKAAGYLPRVDAIGGSSAGVIVSNQIMVASLFRSLPPALLCEAQRIFLRLRDAWGVPVEVANDGDVTALAGAMSFKARGVLGLAMGSSQAVGYLNPDGRMMGWLNELAFAPVDHDPAAPVDEWSGDHGVGALYFSQQAVNKLLPAARIDVDERLGLPERLKEVQNLMAQNDARATKIYETIGGYLGYAIPHYADFYDFEDVLVLGRVTTGKGGEILMQKAREILQSEFPDIAARVKIHVPDEKSRRVGQAVAAASLPLIRRARS